ncbi:MAG: hypothetical protein WC797_00430 [Candidatus Paceibacterota bacterium]|jgi:hypothetical protein
MRRISELLEVLKRITPPNGVIRDRISEILKENIGVNIDRSKISIKNGIIYVDVNPLIKGEIFMRKDFILNTLKREFGDKTPAGIR